MDSVEREDYRDVASDDIGTLTVSTVWLTAKRIFETAVVDRRRLFDATFKGDDGGPSPVEVCGSYDTLEEALKGHERVCARVRSAYSN